MFISLLFEPVPCSFHRHLCRHRAGSVPSAPAELDFSPARSRAISGSWQSLMQRICSFELLTLRPEKGYRQQTALIDSIAWNLIWPVQNLATNFSCRVTAKVWPDGGVYQREGFKVFDLDSRPPGCGWAGRVAEVPQVHPPSTAGEEQGKHVTLKLVSLLLC
jgi:hypothetical protein